MDKPVDLASLSALEDRIVRLEAAAERMGASEDDAKESAEVHNAFAFLL